MSKPPPAFTRDSAHDLGKHSSFRERVSRERGARFAPQPRRYRLYVTMPCPWAHRTLIVRALKGLQAVLPVVVLHHRMVEQDGWAYAPGRPDPLYGFTHLRELYRLADPTFAARPTVPVLWDTHERTIVNNESAEIVRLLGTEFDGLAEHSALDLYPLALRPAIDRWNALIQDAVNIGVYRAGFATSREAHSAAVSKLFAAFDALDIHLDTHRFLVGEQPTEADWRLLPTLVRFEWVYRDLFGCHARRLADYPNLFGYARELCRWPGIAATMDEALTREGCFTSMTRLNPSGIVPPSPQVDFMAPHGRG